MTSLNDKRGFTLLEIIAALIVLGIVAIVLGNLIVYGMQHYVLARDANELSQKAQLAMARLNRELIEMTAVSAASADQIDYTIPKTPPSCTLDTGCQYSIKRAGSRITMEGTNPVTTARVLIDGLTVDNAGSHFLSYVAADGTAWAAASGFNTLAQIRVQIFLSTAAGNSSNYRGTINPRANGGLVAPAPN